MAPVSVGCRDRTAEFFAAAERLRSQLDGASGSGAQASAAPLLPPRPAPGQAAGGAGGQSDFSRRAARIGHGIHSTSAKLARLAQLAKRTSVFDDPTAEINELTSVVKQDITALNGALSELQGQAQQRVAGSKDSGEHSVTVVDALKGRLLGATKEFRDVLSQRQEAIKVHHNRRGLFSSLPEGEGGGGGGGAGALALRRPGGGGLQSSGPGGLPTHSRGGLQSQALMAAPLAQDSYLASRAEALQQVERTISELGGIFQQLATMVAEQGEMAIRIDENLEETSANVESAQAHLMKYLATVSSNRWLILKVFATLMLFMLIFVTFVA